MGRSPPGSRGIPSALSTRSWAAPGPSISGLGTLTAPPALWAPEGAVAPWTVIEDAKHCLQAQLSASLRPLPGAVVLVASRSPLRGLESEASVVVKGMK